MMDKKNEEILLLIKIIKIIMNLRIKKNSMAFLNGL